MMAVLLLPSMWRDRPVKGDPNAEDLGYSNFNQPHRVIATASYKFEYENILLLQ
jgi:hypothetical protein